MFIAATEANHPRLTNQKSFCVEFSRVRDRADLVTDDAKVLREHLEAVTGERIAALDAVELERTESREAGLDADRDAGRDKGDAASRDRESISAALTEDVRAPKGIDRDRICSGFVRRSRGAFRRPSALGGAPLDLRRGNA